MISEKERKKQMNETENKSVDEMIADFNDQLEREQEEAGAEEAVIESSEEEAALESGAETSDEDASKVGEGEPVTAGTDTEAEASAVESGTETEDGGKQDEIDRLMEADLAEYNRLYPDAKIESYGQIPNVLKFASYREKGLTVDEAAYLAGRGEHERKASERAAEEAAARAASKSHLKASSPSKPAGDSNAHMTRAELEQAREIFPNLSDKEIASLYRRVKK